MEELIPLLIFIAIAVVNVLKQVANKRNKQSPEQSEEQPSLVRKNPNTLEEFFDDLSRKLGPQQRDLPDWPESAERPDYAQEMREYEAAQADSMEEVQPAEPVPAVPDVPVPAPMPIPPRQTVIRPRGMAKASAFKLKAQKTGLAGISGSRIAAPPLLRSATGITRFELRKREQLKKALIASMVFGPPRAYEQSFHNTLAE